MQRDLATGVAQSLNTSETISQLLDIVKNQTNELQKRGNRIVDLEDKNEMLQKNVSIITSSNKQLEAMIETLRTERVKLLQEIEELKVCSPVSQDKVSTKKKKLIKEKTVEG